jgi:hypothetical protein
MGTARAAAGHGTDVLGAPPTVTIGNTTVYGATRRRR